MKHPMKKAVLCEIAMIALLAALLLGFRAVWPQNPEQGNARDLTNKLKAVTESVDALFGIYDDSLSEYSDLQSRNVKLTALALSEVAKQQGEEILLRNYGASCIVRKEGGKITLPDDKSGIPPLEPAQVENAPINLPECAPFEDDAGSFWTRMDDRSPLLLCCYQRIGGNYYYVQYIPLSDLQAWQQTYADTAGVLQGMENSYNCLIIGAVDDGLNDRLFYVPEQFGEAESLAALGINGDTVGEFKEVTICGEQYVWTASAPIARRGGLQVVVLETRKAFYASSIDRDAILVGIGLVAFAILLTWVMGTINVVRRSIITESERKRYSAGRVRMVAIYIGLISAVVVLLVSAFDDSLSGLYQGTQLCKADLATMESITADSTDKEKRAAALREELNVNYALRAAELLEEYPQLQTKNILIRMNDIIGSDYLMLYNDRGVETLSSSDFVNLAYEGSTSEFRNLIRGVPYIVHEAATDEVTGLTRQLIGVRIDDGNPADGYASLVLAVKPEGKKKATATVVTSVPTAGDLAFSVDRATGIILRATDKSLVGMSAVEAGLRKEDLVDNFMDYFVLNGQKYYGCSKAQDGILWYSAILENGNLYGDIWGTGALRALVYLAIYAVFAIIVLWGYTDKHIDDFGSRVVEDHDWLARQGMMLDEKAKGSLNLQGRVRDWWARRTPAKKAWFTFQVLGAASLLLLYIMLSNGRVPILTYVIHGNWQHDMNLFSLTRAVIFVLGIMLIIFVIKLIAGLLCSVLDKKADTICRLIRSIIETVLWVVALFFTFDCMGIDTQGLLASLGICSLAISMGSRELVSDFMSGLSIVFTGKYHVGDTVEVSGFRGRVWDIGMRTTTLLGYDGTIRYLGNREVSGVKNLSRMDNRVAVLVSVDRKATQEEIIAASEKGLPEIKEKIGAILSGPEYKGVVSLDNMGQTLSFVAHCHDFDVDDVKARFMVELDRMLTEAGIPVQRVSPDR